MKKLLLATALSVGALGFLLPTAANAAVIGAAYFVSEALAQNAVIGFAHGAPNATFSVPNGPINFTNGGNANLGLGAFLASSPGEITLSGTAADLARVLDNGTSGTILELTGSVSVINGQTFTVTHDDGLQLKIGSLLVVDKPGATSPVLTTVTYTGPTGTFAFDLVYGECCGGSAVLRTSLPLISGGGALVPEPATLAILGTAFLGSGAVRRWRTRA